MEKSNGQQPEQFATFGNLLEEWLRVADGESLDHSVAVAVLVGVDAAGLRLPAWIGSLPPADQPAALQQHVYEASGLVHEGHVVDEDRLVPLGQVRVEAVDCKQFQDGTWSDTTVPWPQLQTHNGCIRYLGFRAIREIEDPDPTDTGGGVGLCVYSLERDGESPRVPGSPAYLADVSLGFEGYIVALPTWLDALRLMRFVAPVITAAASVQEEEAFAAHCRHRGERLANCRFCILQEIAP